MTFRPDQAKGYRKTAISRGCRNAFRNVSWTAPG